MSSIARAGEAILARNAGIGVAQLEHDRQLVAREDPPDRALVRPIRGSALAGSSHGAGPLAGYAIGSNGPVLGGAVGKAESLLGPGRREGRGWSMGGTAAADDHDDHRHAGRQQPAGPWSS